MKGLTDMIFNLGSTRFRKFKKMIKAIKNNDWELAGEEAKDSKWYKQVGKRGEEIVKQLKEG
jgi:lysozyme